MRKFVAVVAIAIAVVGCRREAQLKAREAALRDDLFEMRKAIDHFYADKKRYPADLQELVTEKYLRAIPKDPITLRADWIEVNVNGGQGIVHVKSAATGKALDGNAYGDL